MITTLTIVNYALIEDITVDMQQGLTVITGETGAGKSILLGALSLLLGKRADVSSVKDNTKKCIIEGEFSLGDYGLASLFQANDLDYDTHTIIRREILPSGKSRAFVNDTPVGLSQLQAIGNSLIDIHSQTETRSFASENFQLEVVDAMAKNEEELKKYQQYLNDLRNTESTLLRIENDKEQALKELDYFTFLHQELSEAKLATIDQEEIEATYETLNNAEEIKTSFSEILQQLQSDDTGALELLKHSRAILSRIKGYSKNYEQLFERFNSAVLELEDIAETVQEYEEQLEADPELLAKANETLQTLHKLQSKHQVSTVAELIEIENELSEKISTTLDMDGQIAKLEKQQKEQLALVENSAKTLHNNRLKVLPLLIEKMQGYLALMGLKNASFKWNLTFSNTFKKSGKDDLEMLFSANKGGTPGLLKKVASGGEMSRIMLAVKAVLAFYKKLPTIIFDEIDTGVSGEIALKMAEIMEEMSTQMQLISITHLPQVAAKGHHHLKVFKTELKDTTITLIKTLNKDERTFEIAQMIGGNKVTDTTIANAKELLN